MMDKDKVLYRLLCYGLFPESLMNIFTSESFHQWLNSKTSIRRGQKIKYSLLDYKLTRNNNSPRYLGIPNPFRFAEICFLMHEYWDSIEKNFNLNSTYRTTSMVVPNLDNKSKRMVTLNSYDQPKEKEELITSKQFGKKYLVHADISNFYPSIYTHVIPWALESKDIARKYCGSQHKNRWFNKIDKALRDAQERETLGLPIGCDTSAIFAENLLAKIDSRLKKYDYIRFVDDYKCYCKTKDEAERFMQKLSCELKEYRLKLNVRKTRILNLPIQLNENWVRQLKLYTNIQEINQCSKGRVIAFLDLSSELFNKNPDESSIRYAAKTIMRKKFTDYATYMLILQYFLNLCYLYPYIIDVIDELVGVGMKSFESQKEKIGNLLEVSLNKIMNEHVQYHRSDAIAWSIFMIIKYNLKIDNFLRVVKKIIKTKDCIPVLLIYLYTKINEIKLDEFSKIAQKYYSDHGWWLFNYEYGRIENKHVDDSELELLRKDNISFLTKLILDKL